MLRIGFTLSIFAIPVGQRRDWWSAPPLRLGEILHELNRSFRVAIQSNIEVLLQKFPVVIERVVVVSLSAPPKTGKLDTTKNARNLVALPIVPRLAIHASVLAQLYRMGTSSMKHTSHNHLGEKSTSNELELYKANPVQFAQLSWR